MHELNYLTHIHLLDKDAFKKTLPENLLANHI